MLRSIASASFTVLLLLIAGAASAERMGKGRTLITIGVMGHTGQFANPGGITFTNFEAGEVGGHLGIERFLSDHWTLGISGSYQGSRLHLETDSGLFFPTGKLSTHSWTMRIGGDRYAWIDDDVALYAGPGVAVTRGRARNETVAVPFALVSESPTDTEVGLNGRIGMYARLKSNLGLYGHIGQVLSRSTASDAGQKLSWWASTHEGSVGLALDF